MSLLSNPLLQGDAEQIFDQHIVNIMGSFSNIYHPVQHDFSTDCV